MVSELATFWNVLPGHEDDLRAATERFADTLRSVPRDKNLHTGLRDQRHVIFDGGTRMMWATTFENDWDPYFDDFVQIGLHHFLDWMQHTTQYTHVAEWLQESGGADKFRLDNPDLEAQMKRSVPGLKAIVAVGAEPGDRLLQQPARVHDAGDRQGPAGERGIPAGAGRSRRRGGAGASGAQAAARGGRGLTLGAGPSLNGRARPYIFPGTVRANA